MEIAVGTGRLSRRPRCPDSASCCHQARGTWKPAGFCTEQCVVGSWLRGSHLSCDRRAEPGSRQVAFPGEAVTHKHCLQLGWRVRLQWPQNCLSQLSFPVLLVILPREQGDEGERITDCVPEAGPACSGGRSVLEALASPGWAVPRAAAGLTVLRPGACRASLGFWFLILKKRPAPPTLQRPGQLGKLKLDNR